MRTRHKAHAILLDAGQLLVLQRGWPGGTTYCTAVGGTIEPDDVDVIAGLRREVMEEVGAEIGPPNEVLTLTESGPPVTVVRHFYTAQVINRDPDRRYGPELADPDAGTFSLVRVAPTADAVTALNLQPPELAAYVLTNLVTPAEQSPKGTLPPP
ncbi:NUDIX domain-containing protein [Actinacidiphila acidipaludis]|uniref:NUDIX hydrolase n=1 Tax=Actinacidiphila acidipaludis TaxID=2873382 RepID=A0ABS7QHQ4_9ACTN|nr:NUDIX hydrolase [Streptomyces acidipaludis]MBY8882711.1 NUDIX hydrolase [Streptomyces acidipaludis]